MSGLALSLVSLALGVLVTFWVSRYYFRRSVNKALTPYLQSSSSPFRGVDTSVRDALKITYKGTRVEDFLDVEFLIANTGERAIRDIIVPLAIHVPEECELLDATVLYVSPHDRVIRPSLESTKVSFDVPLLNAGEFFIVKLLVKGEAKPRDFRFTITADDLPPTLTLRGMPDKLLTGDEKTPLLQYPILIFGVSLMVAGLSIIGLIYHSWPDLVLAWRVGLLDSLRSHGLLVSSFIVCVIAAAILIVGGVMLCFGAFEYFPIPKRRRLKVPSYFLPDTSYEDPDEL